MKKVEYPSWISKVAAVPKKNGKIRVCIYFTNMNNTCLMHPYPLPCISDVVDATIRFESISFTNAFFGYNQILLYDLDQIHTSFVIKHHSISTESYYLG